jgi:hypothetical protein
MEVSGQLHTAIALTAGTDSFIPTEKDAAGAPASLDALQKR